MSLALGLQLWSPAHGNGPTPPWDPSQLTGVAHWYRADKGVTLVGDKVSQWEDQVGTAHLAQATDANRPTLNATDAGYNNQPTIASARGPYLASASLVLTRPFTVWIVGQFDDPGRGGFCPCNGTVGRPYIGNTANNVNLYTGTSLGSGVTAATKRAILATITTGTRYLGADNWRTSGVSDSGASQDGDGTLGVFAFSDGTYPTKGKLAELIIQSGTPTSDEKTAMAAYVLERYGIYIYSPDTWDPSQDASVRAWYDPSVGITLSGTDVTALASRDGSDDANKNLVAYGTNPAVYNATDASYGNAPTVQFDGTNRLEGPGNWAASVPTPFTIYIVGQVNNTPGSLIQGPLGSRGALGATSSEWAISSGGAQISSGVAANTPSVICGIFQSVAELYVDDFVTPTVTGGIGAVAYVRACLGSNPGGGINAIGKVAMAIVCAGAHDAAMRAKYRAYFASKFGL